MTTLKYSYKGKTFVLPKGTDHLTKILDDANNRFPAEFPYGIIVSFQGHVAHDFADILKRAADLGLKSIKIDVEPAPKPQPAHEPAPQAQPTHEDSKPIQIEVEVVEVQFEQQVIGESNFETHGKMQEKQQEQERECVQQGPIDIEISSVKSSNDEIKIEFEEEKTNEPSKVEEVILEKGQQLQLRVQDNKIDIEEVKCTVINDSDPQQDLKKSELSHSSLVKEPENEYIICPSPLISEVREVVDEDQLIEISTGVYKCTFCRTFQDCNVCDGRRQLKEDSKFIRLVNHLVDKRIENKFSKLMEEFNKKIGCLAVSSKQDIEALKISEVEKLVPTLKEEKAINFESQNIEKQIQQLKKSAISIEEVEVAHKEYKVGDAITWKFHIQIKRELMYRHRICLLEEKSGSMIYGNLSNNLFFEVGPYKANSEGKFEKTYRLCIVREDQSLEIIGPKFGFMVLITDQKSEKILLTNMMRVKIEEIKKAYKIDKSTEYIIEKLKEIDISENNFAEMKDMIPDILAAL